MTENNNKSEMKLDRNNGQSVFRRFFHIGPILTICIIKSITIQTLYLNSMWFPSHISFFAFLNQATFVTLSALTSFNFAMTAFIGPSYLPIGWKPKNKKHESYLQVCSVCPNTFKAPRSHHCRKCNRCVVKMDHHCPYVANCIGHGNQSHFIWFLLMAVLGCLQAAVILICSLYAGLYRDYFLYHQQYDRATVKLTTWSLIATIFNIGLSIGVVIAVGMLLFFQLRAVIRNRTGIEDWILDKALYRRQAMMRISRERGNTNFKVKPFVYPYDLGWKKNAEQVLNFSCLPIGDGINWVVADGCDQYTLTREQLAQKAEKRARTRQYKIISNVTGSWLPLWSQGFKVCIHPPCTDEPRIKLEKDDLVNVTRWRKYWLFGEKVQDDTLLANENGKTSHEKLDTKPNRVRGWFPRKSAVEFFEDNEDESDDDDSEDVMEKKEN